MYVSHMTKLDRSARVAAAVGIVALGAVAFLGLVVGFPASNAAGGTGMMGGAGMMAGSGLLPFVFFPLAFLAFAGLLALGYVGVRAVASAGEDGDDRVDEGAGRDPIARLQRRYAEGELTEAEFERALDRELADETVDGDGAPEGAERSASLRER